MDCAAPLALIGNSFCNDEANTAGCSYDGGDCCGECANTDLCTECTCHDEGVLPLDLSCKLKDYFQNLLESTPDFCFLSKKQQIFSVACYFLIF